MDYTAAMSASTKIFVVVAVICLVASLLAIPLWVAFIQWAAGL